MAQWIRMIEGLPIVEVKPVLPAGFSADELIMLLGTSYPSQMFPFEDGVTVLLFDSESTAPVNERACEMLKIPTARELRERVIAHGNQPDEELLARPDNARAWEIRGDVLLAHVVQKTLTGEVTAEEKL